MGQRMTAASDDREFRVAIEEVIRQFSEGDPEEEARRWQQLAGWARNRGKPRWKKTLKKRLLKKRGRNCAACSREMLAPELQMHRRSDAYAYDKKRKYGYFEENIDLLCVTCHQAKEAPKQRN